ncbi:hypothetical protein [Pseudomonas sp. NPDC086251]|uniref:hypothetical protein n=1 Tax=Pseudomonas sp. NPDC086251 TaxID=3364431 RepID=UPI003835AAE4
MSNHNPEPNDTHIKQILTITLDQLLLYLNNNECMHPCSACGESNWSIPLIDNMPAIYMTHSIRNASIPAWSFHINCNDCGGIKMFNASRVREYFFTEQEEHVEIANTLTPVDDHPSTQAQSQSQSLEKRIAQLETHAENIQEDIDSLEGDLQLFRTETNAEFSSVRDEFSSVRAEMQEGFTRVRSDMKKDSRGRFWALILVTSALASLMVRGFGWM